MKWTSKSVTHSLMSKSSWNQKEEKKTHKEKYKSRMTLAEIKPATKLLERWQPRGNNGNTNDGHIRWK